MPKPTIVERQVWAHLLTPRGWVFGAVRVPGSRPLLRHLNGPGSFLHLAQVAPGWWRPGNVARSLRKSAVWLVVPGSDERVAPRPSRGRGRAYSVTLLLQSGGISGVMDLSPKTTPQAFLERADAFFVLERCRLGFPSSRLPRPGMVRAAIVNARATIALAVRQRTA